MAACLKTCQAPRRGGLKTRICRSGFGRGEAGFSSDLGGFVYEPRPKEAVRMFDFTSRDRLPPATSAAAGKGAVKKERLSAQAAPAVVRVKY